MYDRDEIEKCLSCTKPKCTNCLRNDKPYNKKNKKVIIAQIDPKTGEIVRRFSSYAEAAEFACTSERNLRRYTDDHAPKYLGWLWRRLEVKYDV